ncbi:MAG TPA: aspartyl protease family protein, partial [Saprospiraceae bacterium]|nr:aspartyl protease family protein [Saprospiraceae bacterium]
MLDRLRSRVMAMLIMSMVMFSTVLNSQSVAISPIDLLQGRKKVAIPFHYVHNFILLDAKLFGLLPVQLIFDTGAEHLILFKRDYTDVLHIPYDKRIPIMGSDLSREIYALIVRNGLIQITNLPAKPNDMLVLEEDYFNLDEMIGTQIAGLIGGGFFKNLIVNIDYKRNQLILIDPAQFTPPQDYISLPIQIKTNKPYVNAAINLLEGTAVEVDLLIDTGAGVPLLLHNNSNPALHLPTTYIKGKLGMGLGGYLEGYIGRIR